MAQLINARLQDAARALLAETINVESNIIVHNPTMPSHVAYMEEIAYGNGLTQDRYPALFASFYRNPTVAFRESVGDNMGAFVDDQLIDYLAPLANSGLASAHAIITRTKPVASIFIAISVMNVNGAIRSVVASGATNSYGQQTAEVQTNDATAQQLPSTGQNFATIGWNVQYVDGTTEANYTSSQWAYQTSKDPTLSAPVVNPNRRSGNLNNIMIGLARGYNSQSNNTDIDYWFWQTQVTNSTLLLPFVGSMYFDKNIATLNNANPQLFFYLARTEGGMSELKAGATQPYMAAFIINQSNPKQLDFVLKANPNDAGNAINFGTSPWVADTQTFFTARIVVTLNDGSVGWSSVLSSLKPDPDQPDGVLYIKPIIYVWHCLAAGTQIAMADGTMQSVENLNVPMVVKSANGTTQQVQATLAQPHWGTVYVITTNGGASLTCSGTHPMMTPSGAMQASSLTAGMIVLMQNGTDTVANVTTQQQSGQGLFNLWLDGPLNETTFYANGFLVGDYQMQVSLLPTNNVESLRAKLPTHMQKDFESYLEDRNKSI